MLAVVPPHIDVPNDGAPCNVARSAPYLQNLSSKCGAAGRWAKTTGFDFRRLGARAAAMILSPWVPRGGVLQHPQCSAEFKTANGSCADGGRSRGSDKGGAQFEHSSLPATVKSLFNLSGGFLTRRDAWAGDLSELLTEAAPRSDTPLHLPAAHAPTGAWVPAGGMPAPPPPPRCHPQVCCMNLTLGDACKTAAHDVTIGVNLSAAECIAACTRNASQGEGCCWYGPSSRTCQWNSGGQPFAAGGPTIRSAAACFGPPAPPGPSSIIPANNRQLREMNPAKATLSAAPSARKPQHCSAVETGHICPAGDDLNNKQRNQIRTLTEVTGAAAPAGLEGMGQAAANHWIREKWATFLAHEGDE